MVLLVITVVAAYIDLGVFNLPIALCISVSKTLLIILFFMHVREGSRLTWVVAAAGFFWLLILLCEWGIRRIYGFPGDGINGKLAELVRANQIVQPCADGRVRLDSGQEIPAGGEKRGGHSVSVICGRLRLSDTGC